MSSTRSIIVTGGCSGIGLAIARHFTSQGHRVTILDVVSEEKGQETAEALSTNQAQVKAFYRRCNVASWNEQAAAFKEVYERNGSIDVVMANAGISERGATSAINLTEDAPSKPRLEVLDVNLSGVVYSVKLASHYMNKNQPSSTGSRGTIICTASNAGLYPFPISPLYAASKFAVIGLVRSLAKPLADAGIQINALAPAVLETNIAPSKDLFSNMIITPMETLIKGVTKLVDNTSLTGEVAEIHGDNVTLRPPHEIVDEDSAKNLENFYKVGYA